MQQSRATAADDAPIPIAAADADDADEQLRNVCNRLLMLMMTDDEAASLLIRDLH